MEIKQAHQVVQYRATALSFARCRTMGEEILQHIQTRIDDGVDIYNGDPTCSILAQLRIVVKN
eukprot:4203275-Ditylum_brightwellii.AAC.1